MGYVAEIIALIDIDQLTMWSKSVQMASKEMAIGLNKITISFVYKLLKLPDPITRAKVIVFLIEVATYCYQEKDHTTSFLVASSLENNTIQRLKKSWKLIPPKYHQQIKLISGKLGISPYDSFVGYFKKTYPTEEISLSETGLVNIVGFLSRIERLMECRPQVDSSIFLAKLRSNGSFLLPLYQWSAENQLKRYFHFPPLSDSDQKAIILLASPYANLTERMIADYMTIRERYNEVKNNKIPPSSSSNLINLACLNMSSRNSGVSLGEISKKKVGQNDISSRPIPNRKPVIRSYPSFHTTPSSMSTIALDVDLIPSSPKKVKPTEIVTKKPEEIVTKKPAEIITKKPEEIITAEKPTEIITNQPTEIITKKPAEIITNQSTEIITNQPTEIITNQLTEIITKKPTEIITNQPTEIVTKKPEEITLGNPGEALVLEDIEETKAKIQDNNLSKPVLPQSNGVFSNPMKTEEPPKKSFQDSGMIGALFIGSRIDSTIRPSTMSRSIPNTKGPIDDPSPLTLSKVSLIDILSLDMSLDRKRVNPEISPRNVAKPEKQETSNLETTPPISETKKRKLFFRILRPRQISWKRLISRKKRNSSNI